MNRQLSDAEVKEARQIVNETTEMATETTLLDPRFYTTDFDEMDRIDVTPVRAEWDRLLSEMKADPRKDHFKKNEDELRISLVCAPATGFVLIGIEADGWSVSLEDGKQKKRSNHAQNGFAAHQFRPEFGPPGC